MMDQAMFNGFVSAADGVIVQGNGDPILLRGVGLGNWLLPEGYMWRLAPGRESPREIEALMVELVGPERAEQFWDAFRHTFIAEADIQRIAAEGFNHVRLPINWRIVMNPDATMRPDGLALVDRLIAWCRQHGLWVLLDLHGAPGGQTGTNIDDSNGQPELFMDPANEDMTVKLWRELALRYRDQTAVLGYDLLNEPLPKPWQDDYSDDLVRVYRRLTAAIREVDPNHLITYEGTHWANNWAIFNEVWDTNSVLQFHKYWSAPDLPSIQGFIDIGTELGLPIYMGEGGENNTDWLATEFQVLEDHGIGWNFWPWKKIDTATSPCSIDAPPGWSGIVAYGRGEQPAPPPDTAWSVLEQLLERMALDQCTYRPEIINALFRRTPISLPATGFGFAGPGTSYSTRSGAPLPGFRSDDSVTVLQAGPPTTEDPSFEHNDGRPRAEDEALTVVIQPGEWVAFDVEFTHGGAHTIMIITNGDATTEPRLSIAGSILHVERADDQRWQAISHSDLDQGRHIIRVEAIASALHFDRVQIRPHSPAEDHPTDVTM